MTTVGELFHTLDRDEVLAAILRLYPEQPGDHPDGYMRAWDIIRSKQAADDTGMAVEIYVGESLGDPPEKYVSVHGRDAEGGSWAIEFSPWKEWLCMPVRVLPEVGEITAIETLAHIFWEMTWAGYDDESIAEEIEEIVSQVDDAKTILDKDAPPTH
jgi:hypothetical protein